MEGDLSLSQSFGGLRIANPDYSSSESSRRPSSPPQAPQAPPDSSSSTVSDLEQVPLHLFPPREPSSVARAASPLSYKQSSNMAERPSPPRHLDEFDQLRQSMPGGRQAQQQQQFPYQSPATGPPPASRGFSSPSESSRAASSVFSQPLSHANSAHSTAIRSSYQRTKNESTQASPAASSIMSDPREASAVSQTGVPSQEDSYSGRSHRQSQQMAAADGLLPPRRSSKGMAGGNTPGGFPQKPSASTSGSPYDVEGGPLPSSEDWKDRGAAVTVSSVIDANGRPIHRFTKKGVKDFNFGRTLGEGSYSTVMAATDRQTLREYAIKVLDKRHIIKEKKVKYVNIEKDTLNQLTDHPGIVRLYYTFQDERSLYFVLDLASNGELLGVLKKMTTFDEECTRFYGAQILDAVDYMHSRGVIHRDLKPENVLLDSHMHVKITDFGTAKILDSTPRDSLANSPLSGNPLDGYNSERANSFVGTAEYVSPELLTEKNACKASDLWAFGCIIYQLIAGRPPFKAGNEYQTFQKIVSLEYEFPQGFPPVARDLVERLLVLDPSQRLSISHIKNHEFFDGITWGKELWNQKAPRLRSYSPSQPNPIQLNGSSTYPRVPMNGIRNSTGALAGLGLLRPHPRVITELPPPSQLDIEWSPVLTRTNERILKLGNLTVLSSPAILTTSRGEGNASEPTNKKLSRFFGGNATKKRQRLVMVTSSARIILAAAGGEEKKAKMEIPLLVPGCSCRLIESREGYLWCIDTKDKHYTFEDSKSHTSEYAQEWLDTIEGAKDLAMSQNLMNNSYSGDDAFKDLSPSYSSPSSTLAGDAGLAAEALSNGRGSKSREVNDTEASKGRKRFSKRQSKSGLAAVF
ncbi:MAG: pkb-activating kinase-like protein [Trizodia sp. TS-e1964]|nr:MAG: pkb-activating kinase-like protein [Trizodia sp. TS-e1964]